MSLAFMNFKGENETLKFAKCVFCRLDNLLNMAYGVKR